MKFQTRDVANSNSRGIVRAHHYTPPMLCLGAKLADGLEKQAICNDFAVFPVTRGPERHQADLASGTSLARRNSGWRVVHFLSLMTTWLPTRFMALTTKGP